MSKRARIESDPSPDKLEVGAVVSCRLRVDEKTTVLLPATVVSVNRAHRHYTVQFRFPLGAFCESYKWG